MIASHYAEPVKRRLISAAVLRSRPAADAEAVAEMAADEVFMMLDDSLNWAWGYAGDERRVGYVQTKLLAA